MQHVKQFKNRLSCVTAPFFFLFVREFSVRIRAQTRSFLFLNYNNEDKSHRDLSLGGVATYDMLSVDHQHQKEAGVHADFPDATKLFQMATAPPAVNILYGRQMRKLHVCGL